MARKSRYTPDVPNIADMAKLYTNKTGIYARISHADGDDVSEPIANQLKICDSFIRRSDDLVRVRTYVDDGCSGYNINRPGFQKMLEDIHDGVINCVVVKDVSRIGRDYIMVGDLLLNDFPEMGVRFVSINDNYDNVNSKEDLWNLELILKTLMHDRVAKDNSKKIKTAIEAKMQNGTYLPPSGSIPYGYLRDADNNTYMLDPEASVVIQKIFDLYLQGLSYTKIGAQLDAEGIPCPGKLRYLRGQSKNPKYANALWNHKTIREILCDQVYIGNRVHGKPKANTSGTSKMTPTQEQLTVIENAHPAIISKELFEQVQSIVFGKRAVAQTQNKRADVAVNHKDIFLGKLICGECGEPMYADKRCSRAGSSLPSQVFYECKTYKKSSRTSCSSHYLTDAALAEIVKRAIHYNTEYILTSSVCQKAVADQEAKLDELKNKITSLRHRERALNLQMGDLYDQYAAHKILKNDFREQLSPISDELQLIEKWLEEIANQRKAVEQECFSMKFCMQAFINYTQTHELTKDIADAILERIEVYANKDVIVCFKFPDLSFTDSAAK